MKDRYKHANLTVGDSKWDRKVLCKASNSEEPGAGKLHAGICGGPSGQPGDLPRLLDITRRNK